MALSNTAVPKYYGQFRDAVMRGEIPVCEEVNLEMHRIDDLIANPGIWYDNQAVEGFIHYCENELTLTDGEDLHLLDSFKLWAEEIFGWYYFVERSIYDPEEGRYIKKTIKKRLINKQYLIVARGAAKSMYAACIQSYFLNVDTTTTHQVTTAPTMKQSEEVLSPIRTAITRARGPLFQFLTEGSLQNTTGSRANRQKLASTKKGIENFLTGSLLEIRPMSIDKLQGLNSRINTVDEWLSGDVREDVIGALEQGASKNDDYLIVAISSEGTVRNGSGDTIKMELAKILKNEYRNPHVSIWWYKLDSIDEVGRPDLWLKAKGKDIYIKPASNLNYDIPVRLSEDCDLLTFSGKYYLGNNCTNRPVDKNGWLECKQYSTDCCHQTYTTYTGEIYKRTMKNGTWGRWTQDSGPSGVMYDLGGVKMLHGTFVTKGGGDSSKQLFTISQLKTRFGIDSASQVNSTQFMVIVQNGDGGATGVHMQGSTWIGDKCYAVFNNIVNTQTQIRINYLIIYTPSEYFGRYSI